MIVYRIWTTKKRIGQPALLRDGWFLFGFLPIYVRYRTCHS